MTTLWPGAIAVCAVIADGNGHAYMPVFLPIFLEVQA